MIPNELIRFKQIGQKIIVLTAWDSISSGIVEEAGADIVLVGDSLAMVALGHATTLPVTLEQMLHHAQAVERGFKKPLTKQPLIVCDLPFLSYQCGEEHAVAAAGSLLKNSSTCAVKVEGAQPETLSVIKRLIRAGIPVMGHLGLTPQSVHQLGYRRQAEDKISQEHILSEALDLEKAGCFAIVLEHIPSEVTGHITNILKIPIIGIGAGEDCDGQVRVTADLLGLSLKQPPFSKPLISGRELFIQELKKWVEVERH
ncbi:3-methyl-2-oxobutanoate hydroxymethyltransferase [Prochlorococcus sp. MIT 1223]|uniref:3-methyl-2-oxobutanoate hydroxymethyltransferase n=1 Tax=Prochlorococcus sp. MIT 1223 TaxID=3096217 RepID=UPI002A7659DA|nr:3-methyl-2-oxobutanoate hydroxymethyltransferase [Prochlorococcus sp. MIT 1223]